MTSIRLQVGPTLPPDTIPALRLLALLAVHGRRAETRAMARAAFARHLRPIIQLAVTEHYGARGARGTFTPVEERALDLLLNHGGLDVGAASGDVLWLAVRAAVCPQGDGEPRPTGRRGGVNGHVGVLPNLRPEEAPALLHRLQPLLDPAVFATLWVAAHDGAPLERPADDAAYAQFERALLDRTLADPALWAAPQGPALWDR